jgi:hypothetical protein
MEHATAGQMVYQQVVVKVASTVDGTVEMWVF